MTVLAVMAVLGRDNFISMSGVGYEQDPTELILSQLRLEQAQSSAGLAKLPHAYFQVEYMTRQVFKMNPEQA
jgi:hypothetical protein